MSIQKHVQRAVPPRNKFFRKRLGILILAILLTLVSVVVGILSQGLGSVVSLILTAVGLLIGIFQLLVPLPGSPPFVSPARKLMGANAAYDILHKQLQRKHRGSDSGALVIYTRKPLVGCNVVLTASSNQKLTEYIALRLINRHAIYVAVVENLKPDTYFVALRKGYTVKHVTAVTVQTGEVAEIRWLGIFFNFEKSVE
jgi:hypothetical protein